MMRSTLIALMLGAANHSALAELKLVSRFPEGGAVCADAPLRLTFDAPPKLGDSGKLEIVRVADGSVVQTVDISESQPMDRFGATGGFYLRYEPISIEGNMASIRFHAHSLGNGEAMPFACLMGYSLTPEAMPSMASRRDGRSQRNPPCHAIPTALPSPPTESSASTDTVTMDAPAWAARMPWAAE